MTRWMRWWFYRNISRPMRPRPPRASSVELPYIWAAHLWCWVYVTIERRKARGQLRQQTPEEP